MRCRSGSRGRWAAVALVQVRDDADSDRDARSGDGENRTDLGYVSEVKWQKKKKKRRSKMAGHK